VLPLSIVAVLAVFAWSYYPVARVQYRETRERMKLEAELAAVQARNARLRAQVDRLRTPEGVEDYARSQLGMVKRGEHVAMVIDGNEAIEASAALAAPTIDGDSSFEEQPVGPWTAFLDVVFGVQ
jgi:cell division protein FtsB